MVTLESRQPAFGIVLLLTAAILTAEDPIQRGYESALRNGLIGTWTTVAGTGRSRLEFHRQGTFKLDNLDGAFVIEGSMLELSAQESTWTYRADLKEQTLTLSGGPLPMSIVFSRTSEFVPRREAFAVNRRAFWDAASRKGLRIGYVLLAVLIARLVIFLARLISRFVIFYDRGPLHYVFRTRKNRHLTMHSVTLNIFKYIVYLTSFGFILTELGVNYTTYLASLSVVGLAIGFGSQGLVQDLVTGFFVLLEGQFDVSDMVEISGQTGIVEEVGLRMVRLRNYNNQEVFIPNRTIGVVGTYRNGSLPVHVDFELPGNADERSLAKMCLEAGEKIVEQFPEIILERPSLRSISDSLRAGPVIRLQFGIWPNQQWIVEQQLIPSIQAALKSAGAEITREKVVAVYHVAKARGIHGGVNRERRTRRRTD